MGKITCVDEFTNANKVCYFINETDIGMGPEVVKKVASGKVDLVQASHTISEYSRRLFLSSHLK